MRVVLDTNVIVAALATRGLCQDVFEYCLKECYMVFSEPIFQEINDVLRRKLKLPDSQVNSIDAFLHQQAHIVKMIPFKEKICRDSSDDKILATGVTGKADIIITGDQDLLALKIFHNMQILSPREFWNITIAGTNNP